MSTCPRGGTHQGVEPRDPQPMAGAGPGVRGPSLYHRNPDCTGSGARTCDQSPKGLESLAAFGGSSRSAGDRQVTGRPLAGEAAGEITASIAVACTHISIEKDGVHAFVQVQRRKATRSTPGIFSGFKCGKSPFSAILTQLAPVFSF